jgi:hypothetical protein
MEGPEIQLETAADRAERHLAEQHLRGWDPYDALSSPLFRLPVLRSNRLLRFGSQQLLKRSPVNLRPALRVPKLLNPVSVGLYLQGQAHLALARPGTAEERAEKAHWATAQLIATVSPGYSGPCWGYPFDWETRYGSIPAGTPTIVATGMITNALMLAHEVFGDERARELVIGATAFVTRDLNRIDGNDGAFCWSYSPLDQQAVLNASLKGSRLLAQAYALGAPATLLEEAAGSARFVVERQADTGAWPYAANDARGWADNFHTGYVLECLRAYRGHTGDASFDQAIDRGWSYYRTRFFTEDLTPCYYDDRVDPVDATACAQSIITLCEFGDLDAAGKVAERSMKLLSRDDGSFAYQRRRGRTVRTSFLRWSTAWMYCALSRLLQDRGGSPPPEPARPERAAPAPSTELRL